MITHIYRFADKDIQISSIYEYVHHYCVDYRVSGMPDFSVTTSVEDIEYEREKSRRDDLAEGRVICSYSAPYLESLAVYRKKKKKMPSYDTIKAIFLQPRAAQANPLTRNYGCSTSENVLSS